MLHLIIRRNTRVTLLFLLLAVILVSSSPWIYKNVFIHDERIVIEHDTVRHMAPAGTAGVNKDIVLNFQFLNDGYISSEFKIEKLNLKGIVVSSDIFLKGRFITNEKDAVIGFSGKLFSKGITLNSNTFMDMRMLFKVVNDELVIESLRLGRSYELTGRASLLEPFETELRLDIMRADIRDFAALANVKNPNIARGTINGVFRIYGVLSNLFSKGFFESKNGIIGPVEYNTATIKVEGFGPILNIVHSSLRQGAGGVLTVEGYVDLRNIAESDLFAGVRARSDLKTIVWNGWDITKRGMDELSMTKDVGDNMSVGFRTIARESFTTYYEREELEEMSLEYKLGGENLKLKLRENEEFFGIEHSIKF